MPVIYARTFSTSTVDPLRERWTPAKIRAVVTALAGRTCIVEVDSQTGHTQSPVQINRTRQTPGYGTFQIEIIDSYADDRGEHTRSTWHPLDNIGMILPTPTDTMESVKWDALEIYRQIRRAAAADANLPAIGNMSSTDRALWAVEWATA